jgi:hypothetical protein
VRAIDACHRIDGFVKVGGTQPQLSNVLHQSSWLFVCGNRMSLRIADRARRSPHAT